MNEDDGLVSAEMTVLGPDSSCSYLPDQQSRFEHRWIWSLSAEQYEALLSRGWRRFGRAIFRPVCRTCRECRSLRVLIPDARFTKSQRRCLKRNSDIRIVVQSPTVTDQHLELYNAYHADMHERRGWPYRPTTHDDYYGSFVDGEFEFSREFLYLQDDQLIGIGLVDMTERVQSSIYFIHHPEWRSRSPGTFSVLSEIEAGQAAGREYLYMGYYIRDCVSMNYKNRFRPHEFLQNNVSNAETPVWLPPESSKDN